MNMNKFIIIHLLTTANAENGTNKYGTYCHTFDNEELCESGLSCHWERKIEIRTHRDEWRGRDCQKEEY
jgi:hypothetical protein